MRFPLVVILLVLYHHTKLIVLDRSVQNILALVMAEVLMIESSAAIPCESRRGHGWRSICRLSADKLFKVLDGEGLVCG